MTKKNGRTQCEVWTRVMGYYSPARTQDGGSRFNIGKRSEFASRQYFDEDVTFSSAISNANKAFAETY